MGISYRSLPVFALVVVIFGQLLLSILHGIFFSVVPVSLLIYMVSTSLLLIYLLHNRYIIYQQKLELFDLAVFMFVAAIFVSYLLSPSTEAANTKLFSTFYLIFLPSIIVTLGCLAIRDRQSRLFEEISRNFSLVSILFATLVFELGFANEVDGEFTIIGIDNTIWFGRYVAVILLVLLLTFKGSIKLLHVTLVILAISLLIQSGARGPMLGVLVSFAILRLNRPMVALLLVGLVSAGIAVGSSFSYSIDAFLSSINDFSSIARVNYYRYVLEQVLEIPFWGYGYGSFGLKYMGEDITLYPHNLFLEVLFEMGHLSLLLVFYLIVSSLRRACDSDILRGVLIFLLVNSMVSGDVTSNFGLFVIIVFIRFWVGEGHETDVGRKQVCGDLNSVPS